MMAVLESDASRPSRIDADNANPAARTSRNTGTAVAMTCSGPATKKSRFTCEMESMENSRPMVKSRKMTPISAICSTACVSVIRRSPYGPAITPAMMSPTTVGMRRRWHANATATASPKMMKMSLRSGKATDAF